MWDTDDRSVLSVRGKHYDVHGAKRGPAPAHPVGIWVGAYKPRILRLVGRAADGWLPSMQFLQNGLAELAQMNRHIDESALAAGRGPSDVRRFLNIAGRFAPQGRGFLQGPPSQWIEELTEVALTYGTSGFILAADDTTLTQTFAGEVAPRSRHALPPRAQTSVVSDWLKEDEQRTWRGALRVYAQRAAASPSPSTSTRACPTPAMTSWPSSLRRRTAPAIERQRTAAKADISEARSRRLLLPRRRLSRFQHPRGTTGAGQPTCRPRDLQRFLARWGFVIGKTASCAAMALTFAAYAAPGVGSARSRWQPSWDWRR